MNLKIFQIYYDEAQLSKLEYTPYHNPDANEFFESQVIADLIKDKQHLECDYFGVLSHKLREKIFISKRIWRNPNIVNRSENQFSPELFKHLLSEYQPDVMSLQRHDPHDPIALANRYHPKFALYFTQIMNRIGYDFKPTYFENVFYCNYFVAKPEIYEKYVKEMLYPAMDEMKKMPELWNNSQYPATLPYSLQAKWKISHYPYHAFICERMFSYFAHIHKLNCKHF